MSPTRSTEAAVLFSTTEPLRLITLELPPLAPGQVLVDVAYSGVCHTQLGEARGRRGPDRFLPHAMGHEAAGAVAEVGAGVTKVQPGDPVVVSWIRGSGAYVPSTVYPSSDGPINSGAVTTFMRRTITCESQVTRIDAAMPLRAAALLGCAVPTGAGAVLNNAGAKPGDSVAVIGVGGVGLCAVLGARLVHANPIIAVDIVELKLNQARAAGATHVINAREQDPLQAIRDITGGRGVDYAIEASGRVEAMEMALAAVRNGGGLCVLAGNPPFGQKMSVDPFDLIRGKRIIGSWGGGAQPDRDIPMYAQLHLTGELHLEALDTQEFALGGVNDALEALEQGRLGRALLNMGA